VVIGDGGERAQLQRTARPNIQFLGYQPDDIVVDYMERCKAFIFPAEEDFGITPVEAQAAGAPVIAYGRGGVTETVIAGKTGLFFPLQTVAALVEAIQTFEAKPIMATAPTLREHVEQFSETAFRQRFQHFLEHSWTQFQRGDLID